jgi:hypothetical protein
MVTPAAATGRIRNYCVSVEIRPTDRTDIDHEFGTPAYRVCFWKDGRAWWYDLIGAINVREAFAWADENAGADRTYTLYAVFDMPFPGNTEMEVATRRVLVRLFGVDPTKGSHRDPRWPSEIYAEGRGPDREVGPLP